MSMMFGFGGYAVLVLPFEVTGHWQAGRPDVAGAGVEIVWGLGWNWAVLAAAASGRRSASRKMTAQNAPWPWEMARTGGN